MIYFYTLFAIWLLWCILSASRIQISLHKVEILEHTLFPNKTDAITWRLTYWRTAVHGELLTHREASRNAKSSRAIPVSKTLAQVWSAPYGPLHWGTNKPGMQAGAELTGLFLWAAKTGWVLTGRLMCCIVWLMLRFNLHKQVLNRLLEPWQAMVSIFTFANMGETKNFFDLRAHPDAQPEFQYLAYDMKAMYEANRNNWRGQIVLPLQRWDTRMVKLPGIRKAMGRIWETMAWHLPMVTLEERLHNSVFECIQMSTARCARASYDNFDGSAVTLAKDQGLYTKLVGSKPWHASPTEHQCTNNEVQAGHHDGKRVHVYYRQPELQGNLRGTVQFRKLLETDKLGILNQPSYA